MLMSACGTALCGLGANHFLAVVDGLGYGAGELRAAVWDVVPFGLLIFLFDLFCAVILGLSSLECGCPARFVHVLTSARFLGCLKALLWICFVVQVILTQFVLVALVLVSGMLYVCHAGQAAQSRAQSLVQSLIQARNGYNPYQNAFGVYVWDTPVISEQQLLEYLNVRQFCVNAQDRAGIEYVYLGCLVLAAAQAFMASAMSSEQERVTVHEHHERDLAAHASKYPPLLPPSLEEQRFDGPRPRPEEMLDVAYHPNSTEAAQSGPPHGERYEF